MTPRRAADLAAVETLEACVVPVACFVFVVGAALGADLREAARWGAISALAGAAFMCATLSLCIWLDTREGS